jgi:pimeloyl-ACP methyl ester carboxylesterase
MLAYMAFDLRPYAKLVQAPTLVIHGSNDQLVPLADAQELAQAIPAAQLAVVDGGSHSLMIRNTDARRQVMAFLHDVDANGEMLD